MSLLRVFFCLRVIAFLVMIGGHTMAFRSILVMFSSLNV